MSRVRPLTPIGPLLAVLVLSTAAGCHRAHPDPFARCSALIDLPHRNPVADANLALAHHDQRVLMLGGFTVEVPGATSFEVTTAPSKVGAIAPFGAGSRFIGGRMLRGTSDVETRECSALRPATERYAFAYSRRIVAHISPPRQ